MTMYHATVELDGRFWFVQVEGVGATQARHLRELDSMVTDLVQIKVGNVEDEVQVDYTFVLPGSAQEHLDQARNLRAEAERLQSEATAELRSAATELRESSLPYRDIGRLIGVSHQRVQQLLNPETGTHSIATDQMKPPPGLPA